jgi:hypothetical protein
VAEALDVGCEGRHLASQLAESPSALGTRVLDTGQRLLYAPFGFRERPGEHLHPSDELRSELRVVGTLELANAVLDGAQTLFVLWIWLRDPGAVRVTIASIGRPWLGRAQLLQARPLIGECAGEFEP